MSRKRLIVTVTGAAALFIVLSLVPAVSERISTCPPNADCPAFAFTQPTSFASPLYYSLGVGGRFVGVRYQIVYFPGWTCHQTSTLVTITFSNGTSKVVSAPGTECTEYMLTIL